MEDTLEALHTKGEQKKQMQLRTEELQAIMKPIEEQATELQAKAKAAKEDHNAALRQITGSNQSQEPAEEKEADPQTAKTIDDLVGRPVALEEGKPTGACKNNCPEAHAISEKDVEAQNDQLTAPISAKTMMTGVATTKTAKATTKQEATPGSEDTRDTQAPRSESPPPTWPNDNGDGLKEHTAELALRRTVSPLAVEPSLTSAAMVVDETLRKSAAEEEALAEGPRAPSRAKPKPDSEAQAMPTQERGWHQVRLTQPSIRGQNTLVVPTVANWFILQMVTGGHALIRNP